jgi:hypothetical protein
MLTTLDHIAITVDAISVTLTLCVLKFERDLYAIQVDGRRLPFPIKFHGQIFRQVALAELSSHRVGNSWVYTPIRVFVADGLGGVCANIDVGVVDAQLGLVPVEESLEDIFSHPVDIGLTQWRL